MEAYPGLECEGYAELFDGWEMLMGYYKEHLMEMEERGYYDSDKTICAAHFRDSFLNEKIRYSHHKGRCSFCGKIRNILPFNSILEYVMKMIRRDYLPALDNAIYDSEEKRYLEPIINPVDFVYDELNGYLEIEDENILMEFVNTLRFEDRISPYILSIRERQEEMDMACWDEYCQLVMNTSLSAEQIISLSDKGEEHITNELSDIRATLDMIWSYCQEMNLVTTVYGLSSQYRAKRFYRCVSFLPELTADTPFYGCLSFIPATLVGTAPPQRVENNRMSEAGDMMFYGADDKKTAIDEVRVQPGKLATIGTFRPNKRFRILDLSDIAKWKCPSVFDVENERKRSNWFFLKEFMERISEAKEDKKTYKPTQVFTKYIQRKTNVQGIKYMSSKTGKPCYVLFVVNRDCLDSEDEIKSERSQLILEKVEQIKIENDNISMKS